ncbi:MAG TPA: Minf_1886 family protein [Candidatus Limnocylindrales bacterium]|nr:Minf_1886 family protein [Candidatus Limnocylindrales bacterium]
MHEVSFEEAIDLIIAKDPRYQREAYHFVREALDRTQQTIAKRTLQDIRHVSGHELLDGIRDFAVGEFGPMAMMLLNEWGIHTSRDFGEIVFNMIENGGAHSFAVGDFVDPQTFAAKLQQHPDPLSQFLWTRFSEASRLAVLTALERDAVEPVLVETLNGIIRSEPLYCEKRFAGVSLSTQTKALLGMNLRGNHLARLNRLLLEDAFPRDIVKSTGLLAKTETDSRADFDDGYDFYDAFRKPFLPPSKQDAPATAPAGLSGEAG